MKLALKDMRTAYACGAPGMEADMRFHEAIAVATQNPVLGHFMKFVGRQLREEIRRARLAVDHYQERMPEVDTEHVALLAAIEARDAKAARAAVQRHIENGARRLGFSMPAGPAPKSGAAKKRTTRG